MGIRILVPRPRASGLLRKPTRLLWLVLGLALWGTAYALFGAGGLVGVLQARAEVERLQAEVAAAEAAHGDLVQQVEALRNDPETIERAAREQLYMARPEDKVYLLPRAESGPPDQAGTRQAPGNDIQR